MYDSGKKIIVLKITGHNKKSLTICHPLQAGAGYPGTGPWPGPSRCGYKPEQPGRALSGHETGERSGCTEAVANEALAQEFIGSSPAHRSGLENDLPPWSVPNSGVRIWDTTRGAGHLYQADWSHLPYPIPQARYPFRESVKVGALLPFAQRLSS